MAARRFIATLFVASLAAAACGGSDGSSEAVQRDPIEETVATDLTGGAATTATGPTETTPATDPTPDEPADEPADEPVEVADEQMFPDVIGATASLSGSTWTVSATLSSPYDTPERYADAWRVVGPDGTVYGERILTHDHASEQPFTRSESGIEIPDDVTTVTIEGRDQQFGYGGDTFELTLSR